MDNTKSTDWAAFAIQSIFDQIQSLSRQIGMEPAEIIMVLQFAERGVDIKESYMGIKAIPRPRKILRGPDSTDMTFTSDLGSASSGMVGLDMFKNIGLVRPKTKGDEALSDSKLVESLNLLAEAGSYSMTENLTAIEKIKYLTLSAGINDRITEGKRMYHHETLDRIKSEIAHRKGEASESERKCLQELIKKHPGYVLNSKLYFNAFVNGTPDAVAFGPNGDVIRCAEFKSATTNTFRQQKSSGIGQLLIYMSIFGISRGDLVIHYSTGNFEYFEVKPDPKKVCEKIGLFSYFRQFIIDSGNEVVSSIKGLSSLVAFNASIHIHSAENPQQNREGQIKE